MGSFSLLRTNTALTTNVKIVVATDGSIYLESIDSVSELSNSRYKKYRINKDTYLDEVLPLFYKDTAADIAFSIKDDNDEDKMYNDFNNQFDDMYWSGCKTVTDTSYIEEFEAFAPIYINKQDLPKAFIIFRVDGPGIIELDSTNFRSEVLDKLKVVTLFDLERSTIGEFLKLNITNNSFYPEDSLELDVREYEFSRFNGIDYESGGYTSKSLFMEDFLETSNIFYYFDKTLTDGYKNNKVIYPHILNMNFLFDDTPATKTSLKKWSINRYYGFYLNSMDLFSTYTFYSPEKLKSNIKIIDDNIVTDDNGNLSIDPTIRGWSDERYYYVEYNGAFYPLIRYYSDDDVLTYKIISDISLVGKELFLNKNILNIDETNYVSYNVNYNTNPFDIESFDSADIWIIKIDKKYHRLRKDSNGYYLHTDYGFTITETKLEYYINSPDENYLTKYNISDVSKDIKPIEISIYKLNLTDIKDFDTNIKETEYARFENELIDNITDSQETKIYTLDYTKNSFPREIETFKFNNKNIHIPSSSEYVATSELFITENGKNLIELWRKNTNWLKWGYKNSISSYDYTYRLNNSLISEDFNRTTNIKNTKPDRSDRNLDYFYTINSDSTEYLFQSLSINGYTGPSGSNIDTTFNFELDRYFNYGVYSTSGDYFTYLFSKGDFQLDGDIYYNTQKYSTINDGDNDTPNNTLFRGIKFNMYDIKSVIKSDTQIDTINIEPTNELNDYKFSILLSENNIDIDNSFTQSTNSMTWSIIDNYINGSEYITSSTVIWNDILFEATQYNFNDDPNFNPASSSYFTYSSLTTSIFWNPITSYTQSDLIYNSGDYWYRTGNYTYSESTDMWNPLSTYATGSYVFRNGKIYTNNIETKIEPGKNNNIWTRTQINPYDDKWKIVSMWDINRDYTLGKEYVVRNGIVYTQNISFSNNEDPADLSQTNWDRVYSLDDDTSFVYTEYDNNIIFLNNTYYRCIGNDGDSTLDNGINIYINKKWKNILINIYINDNTVDFINNAKRDELYSIINSKLTANNFITCINDIENSYGFTNFLRYYIIEEDLTFNMYDYSNIENCPYLIKCEHPDDLLVKLRSYSIEPNTFNFSLIKVDSKLNNKIITPTLSNLDNYNSGPISFTYKINNNDINLVESYGKIKNSNYARMYRFNGSYEPIFKKIELFKSYECSDIAIGNYIFDTDLTYFGLSSERVYSKVNLSGTKLKLKNYKNEKSIYPMIDECGYSLTSRFIFKSTWDIKYYINIDTKNINSTQNAQNISQL